MNTFMIISGSILWLTITELIYWKGIGIITEDTFTDKMGKKLASSFLALLITGIYFLVALLIEPILKEIYYKEILKNIFIGITIVVFYFLGIVFLTWINTLFERKVKP